MKARNPISRTSRRGFNLFEAVVVTGILAVLIAIYLPVLARPRAHVCRMNCTNNLKQIGLSFKQWALDNNDKYPMQVSVTNGEAMEWIASANGFHSFTVMSNELNTPKILVCPNEAISGRVPATFFPSELAADPPGQIRFTKEHLSYFLGIDAVDPSPQMFLSGDDNLALRTWKLRRGLVELGTNSPLAWTSQRHSNQGNILLADGSVQGSSSARLRAALAATGVATNRLLMP